MPMIQKVKILELISKELVKDENPLTINEEPLNIIDETPKPDDPSNKPDKLVDEDIFEPSKPINTPHKRCVPNNQPPKQPKPLIFSTPDTERTDPVSEPDTQTLPFIFSNQPTPLQPTKTQEDKALIKSAVPLQNFSFMKSQGGVRSTPFEYCDYATLPWRIAFAIPQIHLKYLDSTREFHAMIIDGELEISSEEADRQYGQYNIQLSR